MASYLITESSVFRKVPKHLESKQQLILDGIGYSIDIADHAYLTLCYVLADYSRSNQGQRAETIAFSNAWTMVDAVARLNKLLAHFPNHENSDELKKFKITTSAVKKMRNHVQHMDERFDRLVKARRPTWGTLTWAYAPADSLRLKTFESHLLMAGTFKSTFVDIKLPTGQIKIDQADAISLDAFDVVLSLSKIHEALSSLVKYLETQVLSTFRGKEVAHRGHHTVMTLSVNEPDDKQGITIPSNLYLNIEPQD